MLEPTPRDRLLDAAIADACEHGITDRSLRAIAESLGTSHRMLIHHFGSRDGLVAAIVVEVERRQREAFASIETDPDTSLADLARLMWERFTDPSLRPLERLFFELYAQALQGRMPSTSIVDDLLEPWIEPMAATYVRHGLAPRAARTQARLGVAVTRGLLLDLLASDDLEAVTAAYDLFTAAFTPTQTPFSRK